MDFDIVGVDSCSQSFEDAPYRVECLLLVCTRSHGVLIVLPLVLSSRLLALPIRPLFTCRVTSRRSVFLAVPFIVSVRRGASRLAAWDARAVACPCPSHCINSRGEIPNIYGQEGGLSPFTAACFVLCRVRSCPISCVPVHPRASCLVSRMFGHTVCVTP